MFYIVLDNNTDPSTIDETYLHYPGDPDYSLDDIQIHLKLDGSNEMRFKIYEDHPYYNLIALGNKKIYAYEPTDSYPYKDIIFDGFISEIDHDIYGTLTVYCTGVLGLLAYSIQPQAKITGSLYHFLDSIITVHNSYKDLTRDTFYRFIAGYGNEGGNTSIDRFTNFETTLDCLKKQTEAYRLYPKIRYDWNFSHNGKTPVIALYDADSYGNLSSQVIQMGENVVKYADSSAIDNLYTAVIPLGRKKTAGERRSSDVDGLDAYINISSVNSGDIMLKDTVTTMKYGLRCAVVHWEDEESPSALKTAGQAWLTKAKTETLKFHFTAVDLSLLGNDIDAFRLGDRVRCVAEKFGIDATLPIYEMTIYPLSPEKNTISVGSETPTITSSSSGSGSVSASGDGSGIDGTVEFGTVNSSITVSRSNCRLVRVGNLVFITVALGNVTSSPSTSTTLFTIPAGYRPSATKSIQGIINSSEGNVTIDSSGNVKQTLTSSLTNLFAAGFYTI